MAVPVFEDSNTVQFTWVSSVAPNSAPLFSVENQSGSVVSSFSSISSDTTHYYALYTMPNVANQTWQVATWTAQKTVSGSAYNFIRRIVFKVEKTQVPG